MQDLQNQLNCISWQPALASAVSDGVGKDEEAKREEILQGLQKIAAAQNRQNKLSQEFRMLRNRLDDVLINATPIPGSLNNERGKRRRARDQLRQQIGTMLERQKEDREQVGALKSTARQLASNPKTTERIRKVRTAWNLATDGLSHPKFNGPADGQPESWWTETPNPRSP